MCAEYRILEFENWQHAQELTDFKRLIKVLNVRPWKVLKCGVGEDQLDRSCEK
jgi:hypothetical protein